MNRLMIIQIIAVLACSLISCTGQSQEKHTSKELNLTESQLLGINFLSASTDTIYAPNAPSRITRKIRKSHDGNLIMAAFEDVILYDGVSFSKLPKVENIESIDAFDALEDTKGNIWIASTHHGVFKYDGEAFTQFTTANGLAHDRTMAIHEDKAGNIWIATMGGASRYDGSSFQNFTTEDGLTNNDVNVIMEDQTGKIWFGTRSTVCRYDPSTAEFTEMKSKDGLGFSNVWSILEGSNNTIWLGGSNGLWSYDGNSFNRLTTAFINWVHEDTKGNIWTTSSQGIVNRYDKKSLRDSQASPIEIFRSNGMLFSLTEDKEGNIWLGSLKGVFRYDGKNTHFIKKR